MTSKAAKIFKKVLATATEGIPEEYIEKQLKVLDTMKIDFENQCSTLFQAFNRKSCPVLELTGQSLLYKACGEHEDPTKIGAEKYVNPHALYFVLSIYICVR